MRIILKKESDFVFFSANLQGSVFLRIFVMSIVLKEILMVNPLL